MDFLLSLTPILLILFLMVGLRWGAARAGSVGYLSALLIASLWFDAGLETLAYSHARALILTVDVLMIIWAAFLLFRVVDEAGAIKVIGDALPNLTPDRAMQALLIGWVFASFLQGVGGFGVPVAVVAPILVGLGFSPLMAVVIPSIGHGAAVTFGSMGSSFNALMAATGQPEDLLAPPAAFILGIAGILVGLMVAHAADGWSAVRRLLLPIAAIGTAMGGVQYFVATRGAWNLGAFIGSLAGCLASIAAIYYFRYRDRKGSPKHHSSSEISLVEWRMVLVAVSGYLILVVVTLCIQFVPAIYTGLSGVVFRVEFPELRTGLGYITPAGAVRQIVLFRHAGLILVYASVGAFIVYRVAGMYQSGAVKRILTSTVRKVMSSSVSIASMVTMAVIMQNSGMTEVIARTLAESMGSLFPLIAPWIGGLGAFMTGSNTNSNVVFGALQMRTAELLGYSVAIILGAQTAGAALASILAPTKIVVGASTAGMEGKEGEVMRKLLGYTILLLMLVSLLTMGWLLNK